MFIAIFVWWGMAFFCLLMRESLQKRVLVRSVGGWWWWWAGFCRDVDALPSQGSSPGSPERARPQSCPCEGGGLGACSAPGWAPT